MLAHKNCLTVVPVGGLGNRLLALFSALQLVSAGEFSSLRVLWAKSALECGIEFGELGVINIPHEIITYNTYKELSLHPICHQAWRKNNQFLPYLDGQIIISSTRFPNMLARLDGYDDLRRGNLFRFKDKHYRKADTINVDGRTGIHCRRTDWHSIAIEEGYMKFVASDDKMIRYINSTADELFVATDSPYTLARLRTVTGGRQIHYPKQYYPTTYPLPAGACQRNMDCVNDAIIDMILLSRCTQIIADSASSFSTISSILGNIQKTVI